MITVSYSGFLQTVKREFDTESEAVTWLRKVGKLNCPTLTITKH